jgi:hypothetical protein
VNDLKRIAELIRTRNAIGREIAALIGRPAIIGHVGEFVASRIFRITLEESASQKGLDGYFIDGPLKDRSVNIKWYTVQKGLLDVTPNDLPDFYLVLTGPRSAPGSSRGAIRPWVIHSVFLFAAHELVRQLRERRVKIGVATSVRQHIWREAEIYPIQRNTTLVLSNEQCELLALFQCTT